MPGAISLFLAGDVMTGRGIDQVLPNRSDPTLHEPYVRDARTYVDLAARASGEIVAPVGFEYIWGEALAVLERAAPDARIVNLETAVTRSDDSWPDKGIHYRMHPDNVACLTAAAIDCCVLANNHVLDWGYAGLDETLSVLRAAGISAAGAGRSDVEARAPAIIDRARNGRMLVFAFGSETSGIPRAWQARDDRPGVNLLPRLSPPAAAASAAERIAAFRCPGDLVVVSIHWGGNWSYGIPREQRELAHALVDSGAVDLVHGHSSHHAKGIEVYRGKPVIYGCGDFLNDYEGIGGHDEYRDDLALAYLVEFDTASRGLASFEIVPFRIERFSLQVPSDADVDTARALLDRESAPLGARVERAGRARLSLRPAPAGEQRPRAE